ncbi:MAG TPA: four helix bundle protein [Thermodesulfobacteriota bacterium]|nr:four helix bundle protein [Thermodesulfobacteriota bacterium]
MKGEKEDLRKRTKDFALRIIRLFCAMPKSVEAQVMGRQFLRSGTSVGANYREAFRARSDAEFIAKMGDCLKELEETSYWLELMAESGVVSGEKLARLLEETNQLIAIFVTIIKKSKKSELRNRSKFLNIS